MILKQNWQSVTCPHCGAEYHPSEIFMPGDLIGRPRNVIKDPCGKVMYVEWEEDSEPALSQRFICDECGRAFVATAKVAYCSEPVPEEEDFSTDSVSLL